MVRESSAFTCSGVERWGVEEYVKAAFLAMEPANAVISLAKRHSGGTLTTEVQTLVLELCMNNAVSEGIARNHTYIMKILKKVIVAAESTCNNVVEGLYEQFANYMVFQTEDDLLKGNKIYKQISFLFPNGGDDVSASSTCDNISSSSTNLIVSLQCSRNMLEGDTGCALWPSSLFLSEFILSYPEIFSNKFCFEVGSGVGLVGICLAHAGVSKVILTDGDMSSLANMKHNLELNGLASAIKVPTKVECKYLLWESASGSELQSYQPDIVLGADIIYDPLCVPHLIRVLSILLDNDNARVVNPKATQMNCPPYNQGEMKEAPTVYIAQVIRNYETFSYFLKLAKEAYLSVHEITETVRPANLLPYMLSYDRSSVHLYRVSSFNAEKQCPR